MPEREALLLAIFESMNEKLKGLKAAHDRAVKYEQFSVMHNISGRITGILWVRNKIASEYSGSAMIVPDIPPELWDWVT